MSTASRLGLIALAATLMTAGAFAWWSRAAAPAPPVTNVVRTPLGDALSAELAAQRSTRGEAERQARAADVAAARLGQQAEAARDSAETDRARLAALASAIQASEARLLAARSQVAEARARVAESRRRIAEAEAPLSELMAALQLLSRRPPASLLAAPDTVGEMIHARALLDGLLPQVRARTAVLEAALAERRQLVAAQDRALNLANLRAEELAQRRAALARSEAAARARARSLRAQAGLEADRAAAISEGSASLDALVTTLEAAGAVRDDLAALPPPQPRPTDFAAAPTSNLAEAAQAQPPRPFTYRVPVIGRVVRGFGAGEGARKARGITLAVAPGALVVAPADGRVAFAGPFRSYGRIVILDHGGGWSSLLTGLLGIDVEVGDELAQGQPIGRAAPADPRVTVELRRGGEPVDIALSGSD